MNDDLRSLSELVNDSLRNHSQASSFGAVELLCHFDMDYEHYALVQTWDRFEDSPKWRYSLWFWGLDDTCTHVCDFPMCEWDDGAPYIESATAVERHIKSRRRSERASEEE